MMIAHVTSKHTPLTTNEQNELACRRATQDSPGSSSLSQARRSPKPSRDMYMQSIATLKRIDIRRDEERTRACCLPAPTSKHRSSSAAGGRMIQTATSAEEEELIRELCTGARRERCVRKRAAAYLMQQQQRL